MGLMPKDTFTKAITGPIILQQGCDNPNDIKSEKANVWPNIKAMTGPIIVICRYGALQATQIMNKGTYNKAVTVQMT